MIWGLGTQCMTSQQYIEQYPEITSGHLLDKSEITTTKKTKETFGNIEYKSKTDPSKISLHIHDKSMKIQVILVPSLAVGCN